MNSTPRIFFRLRPRLILVLFFVFALLPGSLCSPPPADPGRVDPPEIEAAFRFSKGLRPLPFSPEREAARAGDEWTAESRDCRSCHEKLYDNWYGSRHRAAFTNPLYQESHAREPSRWCVNCHAPLVDASPAANAKGVKNAENANTSQPPIQSADGISCVVCHVRDGKTLSGRLPPPEKPNGRRAHDYLVVPSMKTAGFCGACHQFNFLTAGTSAPDSSVFAYSDQPMQDTLREWRVSSYGRAGGLNCLDCHLQSNSAGTHRFPGGHALGDLAGAVGVEARSAGPGRLEVRVYTIGIGHAFPTGDLFRTLRVKLYTAGGRPVKELIFKKRFENVPGRTDPGAAPKRMAADDTIPPPTGGDFVSSKTMLIAWPGNAGRDFRYEMYMDYLEPTNHLLTGLPLAMTSPLFKKGRQRIRPAGDEFAY